MNYVKLSEEEGIGTVEFYTTQSNSLPSDMLKLLAEKIREAGANERIKVIVLRSAGERAYCAGANFDELLSISNEDEGRRFFMGFANVILAMREVPKFIIGRVHGKAVGGGVGLAAACDYCLASADASIKLSELSIGIGPFVIAPAVIRKMGLAAFGDLTLNATHFRDAQWASANGLFSELFEDLDQLDQRLLDFGKELASMSPIAMSELKKVLWEGTNGWPEKLEERARLSGTLVLSEFTKDRLAKFKKK